MLFSQSMTGVDKCVYNKRTIKVTSVVFDGVLGPPQLAHTWRPWYSTVMEATHKASRGPLEGVVSAQKTLQGVWDGDRGVSRRDGIPEEYPNVFSYFQMVLFIYKKETEKIESVARPALLQLTKKQQELFPHLAAIRTTSVPGCPSASQPQNPGKHHLGKAFLFRLATTALRASAARSGSEGT